MLQLATGEKTTLGAEGLGANQRWPERLKSEISEDQGPFQRFQRFQRFVWLTRQVRQLHI